jgi:hypothetical protein
MPAFLLGALEGTLLGTTFGPCEVTEGRIRPLGPDTSRLPNRISWAMPSSRIGEPQLRKT